jgi:putative phosphoesterase
MPHVVAISDIHGNLAALKAVWAEIRRRPPKHLLFLGDVAAFGPQPSEAIAFLRDVVKPQILLRGNTDRWLLERVWEKGQEVESGADRSLQPGMDGQTLSDDDRGYLDSLSGETMHTMEGLSMYLCHASPGSDEQGIVPGESAALAEAIEGVRAPILLCGHTHIAGRTRVGKTIVLNPGSVGFPADGDIRASYLSFFVGHGTLQEVTFCRAAYNVGHTLDILEKTDMPSKHLWAYRLHTATTGEPKPEV